MKRFLLSCLTMVLTLAFLQVAAQDRTVSGRVTSAEDASPIPGVSVVLKGTAIGTQTDGDGRYTLSVPSAGGTLTFSFIGLKTQEIVLGTQSSIDVSLQNDDKQLEEVVVTAFGVQQEKKALGYAVQEVKGDQFTTVRDPNIVSALSGKIAGAQITSSSGGVGSSSRIILRGANSITGNNQPLFVVDGIPISNRTTGAAASGGGTQANSGGAGADYGNAASDINPDDIESITVLGPNAAALYGSRASNGVILVTTKSGKGTKGIGVAVNSSLQFDRPMKLPDFQNSYGQGASEKYFEYVDGSNGSEGVDESWGMPLDIGLEAIQWNSNGVPTPWVSRPDNVKNFFETGILAINNVSLSGANDKSNFRLSFTDFNQQGTLPNTEEKRKTIALNSGLNLTSKLGADFSVNYINTKGNYAIPGYSGANPMQQFIWSGRNVDFDALKDWRNLPKSTTGPGAGINPVNWNDRFQNNPFYQAETQLNQRNRNRVYGNIKVNYQLTDWLSVFVRTGLDYFAEEQQVQIPRGDVNAPTAGEGWYQDHNEASFEGNTDFLLSFNKDLTPDFVLGASIGANRRDENYHQLTSTAPQLELPGVYNLSNVKSGVLVTVGEFRQQKRVNSAYGRVNLGYKNYIFLDLTARNDWSSTLPSGENSYFYPGVSVSATLSDIFDIESNTLSFLKVRGSWVQVGSDTGPYALNQLFVFGPKWGAVLQPTESGTLLNPALKPEITTSTELGIESAFFAGRLNATFTVYNKVTNDQIIPVQISSSSGYTARNTNIGEMTNKGLEIQLNGSPVKLSNGFEWNIGLNWARNINEVTELAPGVESLNLTGGGQWSVVTQARVGEPYGSIYGPAFLKDPNGNIIHANGLPQIDPTYRVIGNVTPKWNAGLTNTLTFKGITLSVLIDGRYGGDVFSMTTAWGRYSGVLEETLLGRETGIVGTGVIANGDGTFRPNDVVVSAEDYNKSAYQNNVSESAVFDGSFIKLRQVQLGYRIPNSLLGNFPIRDITVSVVGRNLGLLYSKVPHIDPETAFNSGNGAAGMEFGQIPTNRSIGFNVNFKL